MRATDPYFIEAAARILDVLELFRGGQEELSLAQVAIRLKLAKSTAFRLLYTLEKKRFVERIPDTRLYRRRRKSRIGFATINYEIPFVAEVTRGVEEEARRAGLEILVNTHDFDPERILKNVDDLIRCGTDLLIVYNTNEHLSHVIADRCNEANVPAVAITFPMPGARTFGVSNYRAGRTGGEGLGEYVASNWNGEVDCVVALDIPGSSPAQQARITGMLDGLRKFVNIPLRKVLHLQADRNTDVAASLTSRVLKQRRGGRRILIVCYNDMNAMLAMQAVEDEGRAPDVLILSQGGVTEVRREIMRPNTPMWGVVAHFPERFGKRLIPVVTRILNGDPVPMTITMEHLLLTRRNMHEAYPEFATRAV
jgi:ribose transport system substrate-binding protein